MRSGAGMGVGGMRMKGLAPVTSSFPGVPPPFKVGPSMGTENCFRLAKGHGQGSEARGHRSQWSLGYQTFSGTVDITMSPPRGLLWLCGWLLMQLVGR